MTQSTMEDRFDKRFSFEEIGNLVVGKGFPDGSHAMWSSDSIKDFIYSEITLAEQRKAEEIVQELMNINWLEGGKEINDGITVYRKIKSWLIKKSNNPSEG